MAAKHRIFLVGCPRSGTTLLQQMMNAHPDVSIAPETHFIRCFWLKRQRYDPLSDDNNYQRLVGDICEMPAFQDMGLSQPHFLEVAWQRERSYASLFELLLEQFGEREKAKVVGEKTPNHVLYVPVLQQFFPSARFIHIVRDPRAVVNSWRRVPWSTGTLVRDVEVWRRYVATARRYPTDVRSTMLTMYYESLVSRPEPQLREVCHFIGVPYDPVMLSFHDQNPATLNLEREPWKTRAATPLNDEPLHRWKRELTKSMIAQIEGVAWPEMRRYGYEVQTPQLQLIFPTIASLVRRFRRWARSAYRRLSVRVRILRRWR